MVGTGFIPFSVFGGNQWRPFIHVRDAAKAIAAALHAPIQKVGGEIFNVGSDKLNYQITQIGLLVVKAIPNTKIEVSSDKEDNRNYRVSFSKFDRVLKTPITIPVETGIHEIRDACEQGVISNYTDSCYSNVKQTQKVLTEPLARDPGQEFVPPLKMTAKSLLEQLDSTKQSH